MTRNDIVLIWLSLSLIFAQYKWMQAEKKIAYLEGRNSVYQDIAESQTEPIYRKGN